jgi:hypothetical protein
VSSLSSYAVSLFSLTVSAKEACASDYFSSVCAPVRCCVSAQLHAVLLFCLSFTAVTARATDRRSLCLSFCSSVHKFVLCSQLEQKTDIFLPFPTTYD